MPTLSKSDIIGAYLDSVMRKDASVIDRFFAEDVEYMVNGTPAPDPAGVLPPLSDECHRALPWLGIYHGHRQLREFLDHMHQNLEVTAFGPREIVTQDNRGAAFGWFRLHALSTGHTADIAYAIYFEFRDGLIAKYHFIENTFDVANAFRTGGQWNFETDAGDRGSTSVP